MLLLEFQEDVCTVVAMNDEGTTWLRMMRRMKLFLRMIDVSVPSNSTIWTTSRSTSRTINAAQNTRFWAEYVAQLLRGRNGYGITAWSLTRSMEIFLVHIKHYSNKRWDIGKISPASNLWREYPESILIISYLRKDLAGESRRKRIQNNIEQ